MSSFLISENSPNSFGWLVESTEPCVNCVDSVSSRLVDFVGSVGEEIDDGVFSVALGVLSPSTGVWWWGFSSNTEKKYI